MPVMSAGERWFRTATVYKEGSIVSGLSIILLPTQPLTICRLLWPKDFKLTGTSLSLQQVTFNDRYASA